MRQINADVVVCFQKELAREWKNGGDRFLNQDRFNYFSGEALRGRLLLSNRSREALEGTYCITLEGNDGCIADAAEGMFSAAPYETAELAQPGFVMPEVKSSQRMTMKAVFRWQGGTCENTWQVWVYPGKTLERNITVYDTRDILEGVEEVFPAERICGYEEMYSLGRGDVLVTTGWGQAIVDAARRGVDVIALLSDCSAVPDVRVPFFREGIIQVMDHPAMAGIAHRGYAGVSF